MSAESGTKCLPGVTLMDADFLKRHFPNAPADARLEWHSVFKRQALYSIGDLEFISEQTWKDMALPGLVRDKLHVLSGWGQMRKPSAVPSSTSPQRSRLPPSSKEGSGVRHHSPQREHKDRGHSPQRDGSHSPRRDKREYKHGESALTRSEAKPHRSKESSSKKSHHGRSDSGSKLLSSSSKPNSSLPSSSSSSHGSKSRERHPHDPKKPPSSSATPSPATAPPSSLSLTSKPKAVPEGVASKPDGAEPLAGEDWSDSSETDSSAEIEPEITLQTVSASASAAAPPTITASLSLPALSVSKPASPLRPIAAPQTVAAPASAAFAAANAPTPGGRPEAKMRPLLIGKRVDERPASPLSPTRGPPALASGNPLRTSNSANPLSSTSPASTNWMSARESHESGASPNIARNSQIGAAIGAAPAGRSSGVGVPAIIGRRAEGSSEKLPSADRSKLTGSGVLQQPKPTPTKEEKQKKLGHIRAELFSTEKVYVQDLHNIHTVFYLPMQQQKVVSDALLHTIFINTSSLIGLSKVLLDDITKCMDTSQGLGDCFLRMSEFMKMYSQYCSNYDASMAALAQEIKTNVRLVEFLKKQPLLKLDALLIKPIQRLCRYPLLLREMLKQMDSSERDYVTLEQACTAIETVIGKVNENKREFEVMQKVQRFRSRLTNAHYLDLMAHSRQFVREGTLRMIGTAKQKDATVWLFSDILLVCRPAKMADGQPDPEQLKLKASPPLHIARVANIPDGTIPEVSGAFHVSWEAMDGQPVKLVFYTWPEEKDLWVADLVSNIEERRKAKTEEKKAGPYTKPMPMPRAVSPQMRERPSLSAATRGPGIRRSSSLQDFKGL